jgi:Zn-dependent membrane protease YugP
VAIRKPNDPVLGICFQARSTAPDCRVAAAVLEATALAYVPGTEIRVNELLREAMETLQGGGAP